MLTPATLCTRSLALLRLYHGTPFCTFATSAQVEEGAQREARASHFPIRTHLPSAAPSTLGRPGVHNSAPSFSREVSVYFRALGQRVLPSSCGKPRHPCERCSTACLPQLFDRPRASQTFAAALREGAWRMQCHASGPRMAFEAAARLSLHSCCRPCSDPASSEFHLLPLPLPHMLPFRVAPRVTPAAKPVPSQQSSVRWRGCVAALRFEAETRLCRGGRQGTTLCRGGRSRPCAAYADGALAVAQIVELSATVLPSPPIIT